MIPSIAKKNIHWIVLVGFIFANLLVMSPIDPLSFFAGAYTLLGLWYASDRGVFLRLATATRGVRRRGAGIRRRITQTLVIRFETDAPVEHIQALSRAIPDRYWRRYTHGAVAVMFLWWAIWGIVAVVVAVFGIQELLAAPPEVGAGSSDPLALGEVVTTAPSYAVPVAIELGKLLLTYWAVVLIVTPGMILHELGHGIGLVRSGVGVESVGIIFVGPAPVAPFVRQGNLKDGGRDEVMAALAAGPAANVCMAVMYTTATAIVLVLSAAVGTTATRPVAVVLLVLAALEVLNGGLNSIPVYKVDGGIFRRIWRSRSVEWASPATGRHTAAEGVTVAGGDAS